MGLARNDQENEPFVTRRDGQKLKKGIYVGDFPLCLAGYCLDAESATIRVLDQSWTAN
jgi:hypothetical protein